MRCVRFDMRARPVGDRYVNLGPNFKDNLFTVSHQYRAGSITEEGSSGPAHGNNGKSSSDSRCIVNSQIGFKSLTDWAHLPTSGQVSSGLPSLNSPGSTPSVSSVVVGGGGGMTDPARSFASSSLFFSFDRCVFVRPSTNSSSSSDSVSGSTSQSSIIALHLGVATS